MLYLQEVVDLATHYPYPYDVCEYVYLAHGDKAEEILKVGAENKLSGCLVMSLSDIDSQPVINLNEIITGKKKKEDKLPRKLKAGWR